MSCSITHDIVRKTSEVLKNLTLNDLGDFLNVRLQIKELCLRPCIGINQELINIVTDERVFIQVFQNKRDWERNPRKERTERSWYTAPGLFNFRTPK